MQRFEFSLGMRAPKQFKKPNQTARLLTNCFVTRRLSLAGCSPAAPASVSSPWDTSKPHSGLKLKRKLIGGLPSKTVKFFQDDTMCLTNVHEGLKKTGFICFCETFVG